MSGEVTYPRPLRKRILSALEWLPSDADFLAMRLGIFDELGDEVDREELRRLLREMYESGEVGAVRAGSRWVLFVPER